MAKGVLFLQEVSAGADLLDNIPRQGIGRYLDAPNKAFGHSHYLIAEHQHFSRTNHPAVHVTDVMN